VKKCDSEKRLHLKNIHKQLALAFYLGYITQLSRAYQN
jgi:hypothetical protein